LHRDQWRIIWLTGVMSTYTETLGRAMVDSDVATRINLSMLECLANGGDTRPRVKNEVLAVTLLARELDYDHALIRLSLSMGFETGPERFETPEAERNRLRHALAGLGPMWADFMRRGTESNGLAA
jgi:hypothetical protein